MIKKITEGISVSVESFYQDELSNPLGNEHLFGYRITIENKSLYPVRLISRHWYIYDTIGIEREIQGDGVVGRQPVIAPGNSYQYISAAGFRSEIGKMHGSYLLENLFNKKKFSVAIPEFHLIAPAKLN
ncbi:MAG: Co2+/Mg2+ efflux protein ApaG [Chitinophagia bacterium]|nr:Co2+/Mg2+ efflux protein ApaG [Chitinophagia bacterium]